MSTLMKIRLAEVKDSSLILHFIKQIAKYEKLSHEVVATTELIEKWVFKEKKCEVIFLMYENKEVGFALYFNNFSTFLSKPGLYLEDLYVEEQYRKLGFGKLVFDYLVTLATEKEYDRIEWSCLNWNELAINFYQKLGAKAMSEWSVFRMDREAIKNYWDKKK
jgi:GNAT superfamily N-acetyltransferase